MTVIDVHNHFVPRDFPPDPSGGASDRWPTMQHDGEGRATVMIAGKPYRRIDDRCWDIGRKLAGMAENGIDRQVLSPMPELLSYWFAAEHTVTLGRHMAAAMAELCAAAPGRFQALGMVPLQDPDRAAKELGLLKRDFGLGGVEIGSHVMGRSLGDAALTPFYAAAEELGMVVFVHAVRPLGAERWGPHPMMGGLVGYPLEAALAVVSMIGGRVLDRFPRLKVVFAHAGGAAATVLPRLIQAWRVNPSYRDSLPEDPLTTARRFHYDTVVFEPGLLAYVTGLFGAERMMIGTDFPFAMSQERPAEMVRALGADTAATAAILSGNAERLFPSE